MRILLLTLCACSALQASTTQPSYFAHKAVEDRNGVLAPWYREQNGQCDFRVRVCAETLKRYPWALPPKAPVAAPEYVYNGSWKITPDGTITIPAQQSWDNGDLCQRAAFAMDGWVNYYRYSGDAAAIAHLTMVADVLLDYEQTPADHAWPNFLVACPTKGASYGRADPHGMIQLDIVAETGLALLHAYECTGNDRWQKAAEHWGDLLAQKRNRDSSLPPWNRYANPQDVDLEDMQTGGVVMLLQFFDELIRIGHRGEEDSIIAARDAGVAYLRDVLLPKWTESDTWGRHYWDWNHNTQGVLVSDGVAEYLMSHPEIFKNWKNDARNILSLFINRACVAPESSGEVYSGAWAYPEGCACCGRSLDNPPPLIARTLARYSVMTGSAWARELARRQAILFTYDFHDNGVVEDNIDGGQIISGSWFKAAHVGPLAAVLDVMSWLPDVLGPERENHIMRSSSVVKSVTYEKGRVSYSTFDAPLGTVDVLRLAFKPTKMTADGKRLNGLVYQIEKLPGGDCLVLVNHDGATNVVIEGDDPQQTAAFDGSSFSFTGNQLRVVGQFGPAGGMADVFIDDAKQLVGIDCWNPSPRDPQVLYYRNGLDNAKHTIKIVPRREHNPRSSGDEVHIKSIQWSDAAAEANFGEGGGPTEAQRWVFGRPERTDYVDSAGNSWRPATEFIVRTGAWSDSVAASWFRQRRRLALFNTEDPELYRYGAHGHEIIANFTVGPGTYHARLKFAETYAWPSVGRVITIRINGKEVASEMDIPTTAGGLHREVDLVFNDLKPVHGIIEIRLIGGKNSAMIQAIEVASGDGGRGAEPKRAPATKPSK